MLRDSRWWLVVAIAVGLWSPMARLDWIAGDERASYVWRTVEWAAELRAGVLYPRWCPDFYGGYGSPLFVFYGPVIYGAAGLLTATFLSPFWALKWIMLVASVVSGAGAYALVWGETRQRDAAFLGAVAYLASPYRIGDLYSRGDLGEYACLAVLPVTIALFRAAALEARPRRARWLSVGAGISNACLIMTHPVIGLWGTIVVGLVVAASAASLLAGGMRGRAFELVFSLACAPGLAAIYVVPALAYRDHTQTARMIVGFYTPLDQWLPVSSLFADRIMVFGRNFFKVGPLFTLATALALAGLACNFRRGRAVLGWLALSGALVLLTLPAGSGFWVPGRVPLSQFIQFPWRLLGPASLTMAVALGIGSAALAQRISAHAASAAATVLATAMLLVVAWPYASVPELAIAGVATTPETIRAGRISATDADEYLPLGVTPPSAPREALVETLHDAQLHFSHSDGSHNELALRATAPRASVLLALHAFPGWKVRTIEGPAPVTLDSDSSGRLRLQLPLAGEYRVRVAYGYSPAATLGLVLSGLSAVALGLLLLRGSRWWQSPPPPAFSARGAA